MLVTGDCALLEVSISGRNGSTSCVGDQVTYTCTVSDNVHQWQIPSRHFSEFILRNLPTFPRPGDYPSPFSIMTEDDGGVGADPITSALSVTSFLGLDGANIACSDTGAIEIQDATAMVFGKC